MNFTPKTTGRPLALLFALLLPASVQAALIDFESYAHLQNIHGLNLGGVTATHSGTQVTIFDDDFGAHYKSPTKSVGVIPFTDEFNPLVFTFDAPVNFVSLWGGDDGGLDVDSWA
ncbi:MAG: hypothetical protein HKN19_12790, partial [Halioglobus sp.]|nr:hypothetical protein [Halioglobus sp.]